MEALIIKCHYIENLQKKLETKPLLKHILLRESDKDGTNGDDKYV